MTAILSMEQFRTLQAYRDAGHCAAVDPLSGHITLHGYRRYTPAAAVEIMKREMCPLETRARVEAGMKAIHGGRS